MTNAPTALTVEAFWEASALTDNFSSPTVAELRIEPMDFTTLHNAPIGASVQKNESIFSVPDLRARFRALSVGSDQYEYLELIRDLANAPDQARRDVAAWCDKEIAEFDACILNNNE